MVLNNNAINNHGSLLKFIDLPGQSNFEHVPPKQVANDGNGWLLMEMWSLNQQNGLYATSPTQCNSFENNYQFLVGTHPNGERMLFSSLALPLQNTIEQPLSDGGLSNVNDGARVCSNAARNFLNIESCVLSSGEACQSSAYGIHQYDWQPKNRTNVVLCGSESEVTTNTGIIDPARPTFSLYGHQHNLFSGKSCSMHLLIASVPRYFTKIVFTSLFFAGSLRFNLKSVPYMIFLTADDQLRQRVAFALSQILVVTPNQVDNDERETEIYFSYYDIFVR